MKSLLLQVPQEISYLTNYGILGVFAIIMIGLIYFMGKQFFVLHKKNETRLKEIEDQLLKYVAEDRKTLLDTVSSNNHVIENNTALMKKLLNLVERLEKNN
jgi:acyl transferase domain-containing protein